MGASSARASASSGGRPPYARYAFLNPYNVSLLTGAGVTSAATGHWWIVLCAVASEVLWMLFAPDSKLLQRAWFDKVHQEKLVAERRERLEKMYKLLPWNEQQRAQVLDAQKRKIDQLAADNPSLSVDLLSSDLAKLDDLVEDFLGMAIVCARCEEHLQTFDLGEVERHLAYYEQQVEALPAHDERRTVAEQNLEVLRQRKQRYEVLCRKLQAARGQMELMENTFRLLADDIVTMRNAAELGDRLEQLRVSVDAVRETSDEAEELLGDVDEPRRAAM